MLIINSIKMNEKPRRITLSNSTLIDYVFDNFKDIPHMIFEAPANKCSEENLVKAEDKDTFLKQKGEFTIVETPGDPITAIYAIMAVISVATAVYVYMNMPEPPQNVQQQQSSNNSLRGRQNRERPLERIEDIAGEVRSYPTLIQQTYKKFNDEDKETEYSTMCVSKGFGEITDVRDGETPINLISNAGACFYEPFSMPSVDTPSLVIGEQFVEPVREIKRSNEVSGGLVLDWGSYNILNVPNNGSQAFEATGTQTGFITVNEPGFDFERFINESITIIDLDFVGFYDVADPISLSGTYEIVSISPDFKTIELDAVGGGGVNAENPRWEDISSSDPLENVGDAEFAPADNDERIYVGPFFLPNERRDAFFANFVADGLQKDNGGTITVEFGVEYARADADGNRIENWSTIITDSITSNDRDRKGRTIEVQTPFTGPVLVRFRRITGEISDAALQDIKLDALYSSAPLPNGFENFGDVTTVQTRVVANERSTQADERKFNLLFKRKLNLLQPDGTLGAFEPTSRFIDYYYYACLEKRIGRRLPEEVDGADIYKNYEEVVSYFGSEEAALFNYTFDNDQLSFQDVLNNVANACFCRAVRKGGIITIRHELPREAKTLFTHRNKIPEQQTISRMFESEEQKDGIEFQYVDPDTSSIVTINIPEDLSAERPEKFESIGIRNHNQAWWHAWRRYNELRIRRVTVSDTFTAEGSLLSVGDAVLIANNTRVKPQSGDVLMQQGLLLRLSEDVIFDSDPTVTHSIALRMRDGTIDVIPCEPAQLSNEVVLARAPREELYTGYNEERTVFIFSKDETINVQKYIIQEVDRTDTYEIPITAYNYSDALYERDGEQSPFN